MNSLKTALWTRDGHADPDDAAAEIAVGSVSKEVEAYGRDVVLLTVKVQSATLGNVEAEIQLTDAEARDIAGRLNRVATAT